MSDPKSKDECLVRVTLANERIADALEALVLMKARNEGPFGRVMQEDANAAVRRVKRNASAKVHAGS